jgi:hypothetical protein
VEYPRPAMIANVPATPLNVFDQLGPIDYEPRRASMAMQKYRRLLSRLAFRMLEVGLALVFFGAVAHHVYTFDFKPLAAFCIPMLVVFYGFASLLYSRARALAKGKGQMRTLYAAERAVQGMIWYLFGIILGTSLYGILVRVGVTFDPSAPSPQGLWLLLFVAPYMLMQVGLLCFTRAAWAITPDFSRSLGAFDIRRRVQQ